MPKGVYDRSRNRHLLGHCKNCGRKIPSKGIRVRHRTYCVSCMKIRVKAQNEASRLRRQASKGSPARSWSDAAYLMAEGATERQRADAALDKGGTKRHCSVCGSWYLMDCFTSPCPTCGDHLIPLPGEPYVKP